LRLVAPGVSQLLRFVPLEFELLFLRDHRRDLLARVGDVGFHVAQNLIDHDFRIFGLIEQIVDVRANQTRHTIDNSHGMFLRFSRLARGSWARSLSSTGISRPKQLSHLAR
jgi:hypothetical protein